MSGDNTQMGITGASLKSLSCKWVQTSHLGPFAGSGIITEKVNNGNYSRFF